MGRIKTKLIKRISLKIFEQHKEELKPDFEENKDFYEQNKDKYYKVVSKCLEDTGVFRIEYSGLICLISVISFLRSSASSSRNRIHRFGPYPSYGLAV